LALLIPQIITFELYKLCQIMSSVFTDFDKS